MTDLLHHITLNTGDIHISSRADVSQVTIDYLLPLVDNEAGEFPALNIGFDVWRPTDDADQSIDGAAVFHIMPAPDDGIITYVLGVGCWQPDMNAGSWQRLGEIYREWAPFLRKVNFWKPMPAVAPPVPWLGVIPLPTITMLDPDRIIMLGDLERCLFWALAEGGAR